MRRSAPLRRSKPLRARAGLKRGAPLARTGGLQRTGYLKRSGPIKAKRRQPTERDNEPRQEACRSMDCIVPFTVPGATPCRYVYVRSKGKPNARPVRRTDPGHVDPTGNEKGVGLKSPGDHTVPQCRRHNGEWSDGSGTFKGWTKERRREQARAWLATVDLLLVPGGDRERAGLLESMGLGRFVKDENGAEIWQPGPAPTGGAP